MRKQKVVSGWVIYRPQLTGPGTIAVCEEEWGAMESGWRGGLAGDAEAESLARELQAAAAKAPAPKGR